MQRYSHWTTISILMLTDRDLLLGTSTVVFGSEVDTVWLIYHCVHSKQAGTLQLKFLRGATRQEERAKKNTNELEKKWALPSSPLAFSPTPAMTGGAEANACVGRGDSHRPHRLAPFHFPSRVYNFASCGGPRARRKQVCLTTVGAF